MIYKQPVVVVVVQFKKKELLTEYKIDFNIADKRAIVFTQNKFIGAVCWLFT